MTGIYVFDPQTEDIELISTSPENAYHSYISG